MENTKTVRSEIIFITGAPGTGKTTLANKINEMSNNKYFLLSYDEIKEQFWDKFGFKSKKEKDELNEKALCYFYNKLDELMNKQINIITDYPFYQKHKVKLMELVINNKYVASTILLYGDIDFVYKRFTDRNKGYDRHIGHLVNSYVPGKTDGTNIHTITKEQYLEDIYKKDYNIRLGETFEIDISKSPCEIRVSK